MLGIWRIKGTGLWHKNWYDIQIWHHLFYYYTSLQMRRLWNWSRSIGCWQLPRFFPQKHVPTTLVGIPKVYGIKKYMQREFQQTLSTLSKACDVTWPEKCKQTSADSSISSVPFVLNIYEKMKYMKRIVKCYYIRWWSIAGIDGLYLICR